MGDKPSIVRPSYKYDSYTLIEQSAASAIEIGCLGHDLQERFQQPFNCLQQFAKLL